MANFNRIFESFRRDFEDLLWPSERFFDMEVPMMRELETRMPTMDLEDLGKEYHLTVEIPGLKKEDIEIQLSDNSVEIRGCKSAKRDEKIRGYVQRERSAETFYRMVTLPEEIKTDDAEACLNDGLLEITLPKKVPKTRKKLSVK